MWQQLELETYVCPLRHVWDHENVMISHGERKPLRKSWSGFIEWKQGWQWKDTHKLFSLIFLSPVHVHLTKTKEKLLC